MTSAQVVDAIWSVVTVENLVEHVSARRGSRTINIGIYLRTNDERLGDESANELVANAVASWPLLADWQIAPPETRSF